MVVFDGIWNGDDYLLVMTVTVGELEHGPVEIVDLPIEDGGFP